MKWHEYPKEKPPPTGKTGKPYLVQFETTLMGLKYGVDLWWGSTWYSLSSVRRWAEIEAPK